MAFHWAASNVVRTIQNRAAQKCKKTEKDERKMSERHVMVCFRMYNTRVLCCTYSIVLARADVQVHVRTLLLLYCSGLAFLR